MTRHVLYTNLVVCMLHLRSGQRFPRLLQLRVPTQSGVLRMVERRDEASPGLLPRQRQHLQDVILQRALSSQAKPKTGQRPWCVFTAGAMGVGKSHALLSLHAEALFPLDRFQQIDPDKIKGEVRGATP